jgi:hypothetical protein
MVKGVYFPTSEEVYKLIRDYVTKYIIDMSLQNQGLGCFK